MIYVLGGRTKKNSHRENKMENPIRKKMIFLGRWEKLNCLGNSSLRELEYLYRDKPPSEARQ